MLKLILLFAFTFFVNIPCGYWRTNKKKFSWQWFVGIHLPVPFIILLRYSLEIEHSWITTPIELLLYLAGQLLGSRIQRYYVKKKSQ